MLTNGIMADGSGVTLLDQKQSFDQTKLNTENMFGNKHNIKNTFPVVVEHPLSIIQAFPNNDRKQANMINEMTGYFSEYGNLTIFVDTSVINNENCRNLINSDKSTNCYIVPDSSPTIDPASTKDTHIESVPMLKKDSVAIQPAVPKPLEFVNVPAIISDMPEYIDIGAFGFNSSFNHNSSLPKNNSTSNKKARPEGAKVTIQSEVNENTASNNDAGSVQCAGSDDEVIFVKEYHVGPRLNKVPSKLFMGRDVRMPAAKKLISPKKSTFVPRRNPKRKAQLRKNYDVDFEFDFSIDNGEDENIQTDYTEVCTVRRSQRTLAQSTKSPSSTSSTSSARSPIPREYMREWPVDGMHERPNYNPLTGQIEKYDHVPKPICKPVLETVRSFKKGKRRVASTDAKKKSPSNRQKILEAERLNKEFAVLTHETFHDLIDYVKQFKRARELMDKEKQDSDNNIKSNEPLRQVQDILLDNSIFYCLANNVNQKDLSKYFVKGFKEIMNDS